MTISRLLNNRIEAIFRWILRLDPEYREAFDRVFRKPIMAIAQFLINVRRADEHLVIAQEKFLPNEEEITEQIAGQMEQFLVKHYSNGIALRAGNTKTHGLVRGRFEVLPGLPAELRRGLFRTARVYPAWIRFAGPGPLAPADIEDNGILSMAVKVMGVEGEKLMDDERMTQDFTGISAPTFTTPNIIENLKLQRHVYRGTPTLYFVNPFDSHLLDAVMQGLFAKAWGSPLEAQYFSCAAYLYGEGRAIQYSMKPSGGGRTKVPKDPPPNYLREAMVKTLREEDVYFDFLVQFQTDPHKMPIENASVVWPERYSPFRKVATIHIPAQQFDSPEQMSFDRNLSFNPWHCIADHRPLGNQNRARRRIYFRLSKFRQEMNNDERIEPTGDEVFPRQSSWRV
jgi:hypothetical protein